MPPGAAMPVAASLSTSVVGKKLLATTATMAALRVPMTYSHSTGLRWLLSPGRLLLMAAITSTNTKMGATAFRADINSVPKNSTLSAASGQMSAKAMPRTRPIMICVTMLVRCDQLSKGWKIM